MINDKAITLCVEVKSVSSILKKNKDERAFCSYDDFYVSGFMKTSFQQPAS